MPDWIAVILVVLLILSPVGAVAISEVVKTPRERAAIVANALCTDGGYQDSKNENDVLYCITYGLEPEIVRIGTVADLAPQYEK